MPLYFGHKNSKGLSVSPALQSLKIDLLRAPPSQVNVIARPTVTQPGYSSYVNHLSAFLKAKNENMVVPLTKQGYPTNFSVDKCLPIAFPPLVIDYNGPPPSKFIEKFNDIGFERIKMHKNENILRFPSLSLKNLRDIKETSPNTKTPCPANAVNLDALESWILVVRVMSNLLHTHVYPAFKDDGHFMEEIEDMVNNIMIKRKGVDSTDDNPTKRRRGNDGVEIVDEEDEEMEEVLSQPRPDIEIELRKAKPPAGNERPWGTSDTIPNASGLFFPFVPELASYDNNTIPRLFEDYLLQSLGITPESQIERLTKIRSSWGLISKTDAGNVIAHLGKVILLSITSQTRCFPIIQDNIYQGSILSGGRFFIGLNGQILRPLTFDALQEETGSYNLHSRVLQQIAEIATGLELGGDNTENDEGLLNRITSVQTIRGLRAVLMVENLTESDRDEIKKLAVHLRFKNDSHLSVNTQTITRILNHMTTSEDKEDLTIPMHHSALFSRDKVFVSLSAFGYQAPSFSIDNCGKVKLSDSKPPSTLVIRQKTLDVATIDWKNMIDSKEIKNNPRNLSRANRDRTITGNEKIVMWKSLKDMCGSNTGGPILDNESDGGVNVGDGDNLDQW